MLAFCNFPNTTARTYFWNVGEIRSPTFLNPQKAFILLRAEIQNPLRPFLLAFPTLLPFVLFLAHSAPASLACLLFPNHSSYTPTIGLGICCSLAWNSLPSDVLIIWGSFPHSCQAFTEMWSYLWSPLWPYVLKLEDLSPQKESYCSSLLLFFTLVLFYLIHILCIYTVYSLTPPINCKVNEIKNFIIHFCVNRTQQK